MTATTRRHAVVRDQDHNGRSSSKPPTAALDFFEAVDHVERVQQGGRYRDGAVHPFAAFFEAFTMTTWSAKSTRLEVGSEYDRNRKLG
jgi:hypothetical protein